MEGVLVFECNVTGNGSTVWKGTAFECSPSVNAITLLHSRFNSSNATGSCNNGAVVARGQHGSERGWYISQLKILTSTSISERATVECVYDNGTSEIGIGCHTLSSDDLSLCTNTSDGVSEKGIIIIANIITHPCNYV